LLSDVAVLTAAYRRSIGNRLQQTVSALNTEPEQGSNGSEGQSGVDTAGGSVDTWHDSIVVHNGPAVVLLWCHYPNQKTERDTMSIVAVC